MLVAGELGELPHVIPHPLVGGVEEMRAVLVHLDAGLRLGLGVGVPADMRTLFDDEHALVELAGHALGDRQAEKSGADDEEVETSGHRLPRVSDRATVARLAAALRGGVLRGVRRARLPALCLTIERISVTKVAIASQFDLVTPVTSFTSVPSITCPEVPPIRHLARC